MFEEFKRSVSATLYDRTASPLAGSFIISWCLWNYKTILAIFSSATYAEKIKYIDATLYPSVSEQVLYFGVYPLITSLAWILLYPWPAKWIYHYSYKQKQALKAIRRKIDDESLLTKEESRKLKAELEGIEDKCETKLYQKDREMGLVSQELKEQQERNKQLVSENDNLREQLLHNLILTADQRKLLKKLEQEESSYISLETILKIKRSDLNYALALLEEQGLITHLHAESPNEAYRITTKGRKAARNYDSNSSSEYNIHSLKHGS